MDPAATHRAVHNGERWAWLPALVLLWFAIANFAPTTTTDLWTHLQVGEDVLAEGVLPSAERYSATAEGRPFIAYEWLPSVGMS